MFQRRRSTLGRRHLLAQQHGQGSKPIQVLPSMNAGAGGSGGINASSIDSRSGRRSEKKKTPSNLNRASRELMFKKRLFNKSPAEINCMGAFSVQDQERTHTFLNESSLNETGIASIAPTPGSSSRFVPLTPMSAQRRRAELELTRYRQFTLPPSLSTFAKSDLVDKSSTSNHLKKTASATYDFDNLKPPDSPGPLRYDRLILEEKLEKPVDPDVKKLQTATIEDPNARLQFSPPLSSTCIGTPDSGKKTNTNVLKEELKEAVQNSARKLSIIKEDCDSSVVEFEQNEQTINELDETIVQSTLNNTLKSNVTYLENIVEEHVNHLDVKEEFDEICDNVLSRIDNIELAVINRAKESVSNMKTLKQQVENLQKAVENIERHEVYKFKEDIENVRTMKKLFKSLKSKITIQQRSTQNKENESSYLTNCNKKLTKEENWFNGIKSENPSLLKTPKFSRRINQSSVWTPHSLSKVLHDQMNELYD